MNSRRFQRAYDPPHAASRSIAMAKRRSFVVAWSACLLIASVGSPGLHAAPSTLAQVQDSKGADPAQADAIRAMRDRAAGASQRTGAPPASDPYAPPATGTQMQGGAVDQAMHAVIVSPEGQYSIWPLEQKLPPGWTETGVRGTEQQCRDHLRSMQGDGSPLPAA
jgi:MbtH protein